MKNITKCIDINSEYCPCLLSQTNHCVFCSHLSGETVCNCNWSGTCILYEKYWKDREYAQPIAPLRLEETVNFLIKEQLGKDTYLLKFELSLDFAVKLNKIGSFVFLRSPEDAFYFNFPVGIMKVAERNIEVVIETLGPKSSKIFMNNNKIIVRGPYYNGVLGHPWIDNLTNGKIILVAGGIGQAPALPLAFNLGESNKKNQVLALLAPGKVGKTFIEADLMKMGIDIHTVPSMRKEGTTFLKQTLNHSFDLVVSAGPDEQHKGIIKVLNELELNIPMAATNNAIMCCGEGICGSCLKRSNSTKSLIRMCKIQTGFTNLKDI